MPVPPPFMTIYDDATAEQLGLKAGPIEGPAHFSQFVPLPAHGVLLGGTDIYNAAGQTLKAQMLLNHAVMKASYPGYEAARAGGCAVRAPLALPSVQPMRHGLGGEVALHPVVQDRRPDRR